MAMSKYRDRQKAATTVIKLMGELVNRREPKAEDKAE